MVLVEMLMPRMGESVFEATVIKWLKKEGDKISKEESIVEVATDKVDTDVPASDAGVLHQIIIKEGQIAKIGEPIAIISVDKQASIPEVISQETIEEAETIIEQQIENAQNLFSPEKESVYARFYSPLVLNIAKEEKISMAELEKIEGTGKENRVTKQDLLAYIEQKAANQIPLEKERNSLGLNSDAISTLVASPQIPVQKPSFSFSGEFEIREMDRTRKIIAQRMLESQQISATVTSFVEADVTMMVHWRNKIKHEFMKKEGEGTTFTPIFVEAIAKALKEFPLLNSSIEGDKIIIKKDINIGLAVALADGNLIVPVIKNADRYNINGLTRAVNETIKKAKNNKLKAEDLQDGTFTLSNIGGFGNLMGTPVIVQPQVGIIAAGSIRKKPAVIETEFGDTIGIRQFMFLSHSYDHRIIDGSLGGSFVKRVADLLEKFDIERKI
jgi:2-oxoglutarate dehydrogenase E2 component (dihydrolipoamide succinyltransferase)